MKSLILATLAAVALLSAPAPAAATEPAVRTVSATVAAPPVAPAKNPAPLMNLSLSVLLGGMVMGATKNLSQTYLWEGISYGPGENVDVPDDFPEIDGETGQVLHPQGSAAARNAARSARVNANNPRPIGSPAPGAGPGLGVTVSGKSAEELEELTKEELVAMADKLGVTVSRADGSAGDPLKADYVATLGATKTA